MQIEDSICINLKGGLGNQMFQFAFGYYLAEKYGKNLYFDTKELQKDKNRSVELNKYSIPIKQIETSAIPIVYSTSLTRRVFRKLNPRNRAICLEPSYLENEIKNDFNNYYYFDGYWQNYKYFEHLRDQLISIFKPKHLSNEAIIFLDKIRNEQNSVAIHIRKTDYLLTKNKKIYSSCGLDYYREALNQLIQKTSSVKIFVFTDDILWVNENFNIDFSKVVIGPDDCQCPVETLYLMSNCQFFITSNSTFSWWAAWLAENKNKLVFTPENWFQDKVKPLENLIPSDWIKIANE